MVILFLTWIAVGIGLVWLVGRSERSSAGLPLAYFLGLSLIHVPGALIYLDSENLSSIATATRTGFEQTIIGMVAFLVGVIIARYTFVPATASTGRPLGFTQETFTAL